MDDKRKVKWHLIKRSPNGEVFTVHIKSDEELGGAISAAATVTPEIEMMGVVRVG